MDYPIHIGDVFVFSDVDAAKVDALYIDEDGNVQIRIVEGTYGAQHSIIAPSRLTITYDDLAERVDAEDAERIPGHATG